MPFPKRRFQGSKKRKGAKRPWKLRDGQWLSPQTLAFLLRSAGLKVLNYLQLHEQHLAASELVRNHICKFCSRTTESETWGGVEQTCVFARRPGHSEATYV